MMETFPCDECEKVFSYRQSLNEHKRDKHPPTGALAAATAAVQSSAAGHGASLVSGFVHNIKMSL